MQPNQNFMACSCDSAVGRIAEIVRSNSSARGSMSAIVGTEFTESVVFQVVSRREEQPWQAGSALLITGKDGTGSLPTGGCNDAELPWRSGDGPLCRRPGAREAILPNRIAVRDLGRGRQALRAERGRTTGSAVVPQRRDAPAGGPARRNHSRARRQRYPAPSLCHRHVRLGQLGKAARRRKSTHREQDGLAAWRTQLVLPRSGSSPYRISHTRSLVHLLTIGRKEAKKSGSQTPF